MSHKFWFLIGCCVGFPLPWVILPIIEKRLDEKRIYNSIPAIHQSADNGTKDDATEESEKLPRK